MIILKVFSKNREGWKRLVDIIGFDPFDSTKDRKPFQTEEKKEVKGVHVGRWGRDGRKKAKKKPATTQKPPEPTTPEVKFPKITKKQLKIGGLTMLGAAALAGGKHLYDKHKDQKKQDAALYKYRKQFKSQQ